MNVLLGFFGNAWTQLVMWIIAAIIIYTFSSFMKGANDTWNWVAAGVFLYGIRIGYKLLPFYKASMATEAARYVIGIIGIVVLFVGLHKYYNNDYKPIAGGI